MKIWFDTEFIEDGRTIDLISIGMVDEAGRTFYAESSEADLSRASPWVRENVIPCLSLSFSSREAIAAGVRAFAGASPQFWADHASYDWVALCQLFGTMMDLPPGWPMFVRDIQQLWDTKGNPRLPVARRGVLHNALNDALTCRDQWLFLTET
jgi:hypothetical protein